MQQKEIAGLKIHSVGKKELLETLLLRISSGQHTFITTPYSEFLFRALQNPETMSLLNKADFALPDGIGLFWASKYLSIPLTAKSYPGKILQAFWQLKYSLAAILLYPKWIKSAFVEKIPGSDLVWDMAKMANDNGWSIYLLGGYGETAKLAAERLKIENSKLKIAGTSSKNPEDKTIIDDIKMSYADIVLVAYGPIKQEQWIVDNMDMLPAKLYIGLGGTFDYLAGVKTPPPKFIRYVGLEWLWRLFTQPKRYGRIWQATYGLIDSLIRYKVFKSLPFRPNAVSVIINNDNKIFIGKYNSQKAAIKKLGRATSDFHDYWQFPQGGIEAWENPVEGARRELVEETGMNTVLFLGFASRTYSYEWVKMAYRPLLVNKHYQFKGQEQHIAFFHFSGPESEIRLEKNEFLEYRWIAPENLVNSISHEKRPLAQIVLEELPKFLEKIKYKC